MEKSTKDKIHVGLILTGLIILLLGFLYCVSRIWISRFYDSLWDGWFRGEEDDFHKMIINNKKMRRKSSEGKRKTQNIQLNSTNGYFIKTPWVQDGVSRDKMDQTDKSVDKFLHAVINDRHGY